MSEREFEKLSERTVFDGRIMRVAVEEFRFADGEVAEREVVHHPGAVGIVAHDGECVYLTIQPREAIDDPDCLEIPAGRLDVDGEPPMLAAKRELEEEIGKTAGSFVPMRSYHSSVGSFDEIVHLFLATDLSDQTRDSGENERIEVIRWPLAALDAAIADTTDAKTIIGLMTLREHLRG